MKKKKEIDKIPQHLIDNLSKIEKFTIVLDNNEIILITPNTSTYNLVNVIFKDSEEKVIYRTVSEFKKGLTFWYKLSKSLTELKKINLELYHNNNLIYKQSIEKTKNEKLKIAIVFSGQIRNLNDSKKYWKQLIDEYDMDVYGSFWENDDKIDNIENFINIYNPIKCETETYESVKDTMIEQLMNDIRIPYDEINRNECKSIEKSNILYMTYKMWKGNSLTKNNKKYDIIIRSRTDIILENLTIEKNNYFNVPYGKIYLSSDTKTWGFLDIFSYSTPEIMDYYSSFIFYFMSYIKSGYYIWSPEMLLKIHLNQKKITINELDINPLICRVIDGIVLKGNFSITNKHLKKNIGLIHLHPNEQVPPYTMNTIFKTCYKNNEHIYNNNRHTVKNEKLIK